MSFVLRVALRDLLDVGAWRRARRTRSGAPLQRLHELDAVAEAHVAHAAEVERQHRADQQLRGERLGRGDADLGPDVLVDAAVGLAGDGGADDIVDREHLVALALGFAHRGERVDRLAGLAHHEEERVAIERGVAVAELRGVVALDGMRA
jgi:hypothetical protein